MRRQFIFLSLSITILFLWTGRRDTFAQGGGPRETITFEGFLFPDNVIVDSTRTLTLCLVNQGQENELIRQAKDDDVLLLTIPLGLAESDLESNRLTQFLVHLSSQKDRQIPRRDPSRLQQ